MEPRPRIRQQTPLEALTPPPNGRGASTSSPSADDTASSETAAAAAVLPRVVEHYHRTFCEREDAQAYLKKRGLTDVDLWRAHRIGYADGSLLKVIPKTGEVRARPQGARGRHRPGPRAPGRLPGGPDPRSRLGSVDEPLRPGDEDRSPLLPPGPSARCRELPRRAALGGGDPHRVHPRRLVLPPGRGLDRDPDLRHERLHRRPPRPSQARRRQACRPGPRQRRCRTEGHGRLEGEAGAGRDRGARRVLPEGDQGRERAPRLPKRRRGRGLPPAPRRRHPGRAEDTALFASAQAVAACFSLKRRGRQDQKRRAAPHAATASPTRPVSTRSSWGACGRR